mgnify:CR=1 FL=1
MTKETATFTQATIYEIKILKYYEIISYRIQIEPCTTLAQLISDTPKAESEVVDVYVV